jgi:methionine sulfoxide reductase heme-binding subunit
MTMAGKWPLGLGLALGTLALCAGIAAGTSELESWQLAARWTARVGFPIFLVTYLASSLVRLSPAPWSRSLLRDRRWWGLGFAGSHTIHLVALIMATSLSPEPRTLTSLVPGGTAYLFILVMALTSNGAAMRALGRNWKRLHSAGIHTIWLIFTLAYGKRIAMPETRAVGLTMTTLALVALAMRIFARRQRTVQALA